MKYSHLFLTATAVLILFLAPLTSLTADPADTTSSGTDEVIVGRDGADTINSGDGNDNVSGKGGNDSIDAGEGDDLVSGDEGDDKIRGGAGDDYILGGDGNDTAEDGPGSDFISLGPGNDTLVYFLDNNKGYKDYAVGGEGEDTLIIVSDETLDDLMKNQIIKYYEQQNMVGADIGRLGKLNMTLGTSDFEHITFAAGFAF